MKLELRPPSNAKEWRICRTLLPETFISATESREYLLCLREESPRLVGAISFLKQGQRLSGLRLHVIPRFRRLGVATRALALVNPEGVLTLTGVLDVRREPEAVLFCERTGFRRSNGITTVEADLEGSLAYLEPLRKKLTSRPALRTAKLADVPLAEVARLHAHYIAHHSDLNPWRASLAEMPELANSRVALISGKVAGMLLSEATDKVGLCRSLVAEAGPMSRWVNLTLLMETVDLLWSRGLRRVQFSYADSNRNTLKSALRAKAGIIAEVAEYTFAPSR
jgi:hypothetical protein